MRKLIVLMVLSLNEKKYLEMVVMVANLIPTN